MCQIAAINVFYEVLKVELVAGLTHQAVKELMCIFMKPPSSMRMIVRTVSILLLWLCSGYPLENIFAHLWTDCWMAVHVLVQNEINPAMKKLIYLLDVVPLVKQDVCFGPTKILLHLARGKLWSTEKSFLSHPLVSSAIQCWLSWKLEFAKSISLWRFLRGHGVVDRALALALTISLCFLSSQVFKVVRKKWS